MWWRAAAARSARRGADDPAVFRRAASCSCEAHECGAELSREGHQWIAAEWPLAHRAPWSNSLPPLRHCDRVGVFVASPALFSLPPTYLLKFPYGH